MNNLNLNKKFTLHIHSSQCTNLDGKKKISLNPLHIYTSFANYHLKVHSLEDE